MCANQNSYELKPGELVLLKIPELLRDDWPLGKLIKVFKDSNKVIRSLEVSVRGEIYRRSIEFIVPVLNYPFKTLCLFIKLLLFSSLSYHYGLIFILLFALTFIHSCIVYGKT